ncbi:hypothetical protein ACJMQP_21645, partial [Rhodopseudomonas palustris]
RSAAWALTAAVPASTTPAKIRFMDGNPLLNLRGHYGGGIESSVPGRPHRPKIAGKRLIDAVNPGFQSSGVRRRVALALPAARQKFRSLRVFGDHSIA